MTIIERVHATELPLHELVVIGSGLLDAFGLRHSSDVDLVVTERLFAELRTQAEYALAETEYGEVLTRGDAEIWQDWGSDEQGVLTFARLYEGGVTVEGVRFCSPNVIVAKKRQRGLQKDRDDIAAFEQYLATSWREK